MSSFRRYGVKPPTGGPGPEGYEPHPKVVAAVNAALAVRQPLLVLGEPGVGKTDLAESVKHQLGWAFEKFVARSDSRGRDAIYRFDHLLRLHDAQVLGAAKDLTQERAAKANSRFEDDTKYVRMAPLGRALMSTSPHVVLIDEVDKAPSDFPDDILNELDKGDILIDELGKSEPAKPGERLVILTSNLKRPLSEPFLRRCVVVTIPFPDTDHLKRIVRLRNGLDGSAPRTVVGRRVAAATADAATERFVAVRRSLDESDWRKIPSIGELLRWVDVLTADPELADVDLATAPLGALHPGVLIKTADDARKLGVDV